MSAEKIEQLLTGAGAAFERSGQSAWKLKLGPERNVPASLACIKCSLAKDRDLIKIFMPVGKLPPGATTDFFKDVFRKNRDLGHGGFALAGEDNVVFVDTLQLATCDQNEMDATLDWLLKSVDIYKEKLDRSKLPYIDAL